MMWIGCKCTHRGKNEPLNLTPESKNTTTAGELTTHTRWCLATKAASQEEKSWWRHHTHRDPKPGTHGAKTTVKKKIRNNVKVNFDPLMYLLFSNLCICSSCYYRHMINLVQTGLHLLTAYKVFPRYLPVSAIRKSLVSGFSHSEIH